MNCEGTDYTSGRQSHDLRNLDKLVRVYFSQAKGFRPEDTPTSERVFSVMHFLAALDEGRTHEWFIKNFRFLNVLVFLFHENLRDDEDFGRYLE